MFSIDYQNKKMEENMDSRKRNVIVAIVLFGTFSNSLCQTIMAGITPTIMREFNISAGVGQWLTTIYLLFLGVIIPVTGFMMENYSIRKLFLSAMTVFFLGSTLAAISQNFETIFISRAIQAFGAGVLMPLTQVTVFRLYPSEVRGKMMGYVGMTTAFAPALGPALAGWFTDMWGWRSIFVVLSITSIISIVISFFLLDKEKVEKVGKLDIISFALSTLGFGALLVGVTNQGNFGILSPYTLIPLVLGLVSMFLFSKKQLKSDYPFLNIKVFFNKHFTVGTIILLTVYGSLLSATFTTSIYIQSVLKLTATTYGLVILPGTIFLALFNPLTGKMLDKHGPYHLIIIGLSILAFGTLLLSTISEDTHLLIVVIYYGIRMIGVVAVFQPVTTWSVNSLSHSEFAHGTAISATLRQVGGAMVNSVFISIMTIVSNNSGLISGIRASFKSTFVFIVIIFIFAFYNIPSKRSVQQLQ